MKEENPGKKVVEDLEEVGWFRFYPDEDKERFIAAILGKAEEQGRGDLDQLLHGVWTDIEDLHQGVYTELIKELGRASFGLFRPRDIVEKWESAGQGPARVSLSFKLGLGLHGAVWEQQGHYLERDFFDLIAKALAEASPGLALAYLGPEAHVIVCCKKAFRKAMEKGLLPDLSSIWEDESEGKKPVAEPPPKEDKYSLENVFTHVFFLSMLILLIALKYQLYTSDATPSGMDGARIGATLSHLLMFIAAYYLTLRAFRKLAFIILSLVAFYFGIFKAPIVGWVIILMMYLINRSWNRKIEELRRMVDSIRR